MFSEDLYARIAADFPGDGPGEDASRPGGNEFIHPGFAARGAGLMLDNADEIVHVYTAVFPDQEIIEAIIRSGRRDALLVTLHAMGYNGLNDGNPFYELPAEYYKTLKDRHISLYVLRPPMEIEGKYSATMAFVRMLGLKVVGEYRGSDGVTAGVICNAAKQSAANFAEYVQIVVGHEVKLRLYGDDRIDGSLVAIVAGAGCRPQVPEDLARLQLNLYLTGYTCPSPIFPDVVEFHRQAQRLRLNVIGATRYSTEKFAPMALRGYFKGLGLGAEFIEGRHFLQDL